MTWTIVECTLGIVCVSIPTLRPLVRKVFPNLFMANTSYNSYKMSNMSAKGARGAEAAKKTAEEDIEALTPSTEEVDRSALPSGSISEISEGVGRHESTEDLTNVRTSRVQAGH